MRNLAQRAQGRRRPADRWTMTTTADHNRLRRHPEDVADVLDGHAEALRTNPVDEALVVITAQRLNNLATILRGAS